MELTDELKREYKSYDQNELNNAFIKACESGHLDIVKYLLTSTDLKKHANIHANDDYGVRLACKNGHLEIVKYLLTSPDLIEHANIHARGYFSFQWACQKGHLEVVKYILTSSDLEEHADIHADDDLGFKWACNYEYLTIVQYLLSFGGKQCINFQETNYNLDWAIENQYDDVILAMMKNLKNNHFMEYFECLPKIEEYSKELYEQVKNLELSGDEVNPSETSLYL